MSDFRTALSALSNLEGKILVYPVHGEIEALLVTLVKLSSHADILQKCHLNTITAATKTLQLDLEEVIKLWKRSRPEENLDELLI